MISSVVAKEAHLPNLLTFCAALHHFIHRVAISSTKNSCSLTCTNAVVL